ncbi:MAG: LAGLIDADG family homing endonuclease, partial [bacterium]|nr:LAGLIDADG family homing endonuclease [bacterium]
MGIRYRVNDAFFDTWSEEMAYVLGFLYADGSLEDASYIRGKYVRVTNTDQDRIVTIRRLLESEHTIVQHDKGGNYKRRYLLRIGNSKMYNRLVRLGLTPHKSFTMEFPKVPLKNLGSFVRGYFDGDGCVHIGRYKNKPSRLMTIFTSGSKKFLDKLHVLLKTKIGIVGNGLY